MAEEFITDCTTCGAYVHPKSNRTQKLYFQRRHSRCAREAEQNHQRECETSRKQNILIDAGFSTEQIDALFELFLEK